MQTKPKRNAYARIVTRHCECQLAPNEMKGISDTQIAEMLNGTLTWPRDNATTASCCGLVPTPGVVGGSGDRFEVSRMFRKEHSRITIDFILLLRMFARSKKILHRGPKTPHSSSWCAVTTRVALEIATTNRCVQ
ncbi:hypothetical protein diail_10494 [Diaporthe ilicicola]|nr:hypothetical protein diail_10494 [Diaporthe ilicicola]